MVINKKENIDAITGLRAFAAFLVFLHHSSPSFQVPFMAELTRRLAVVGSAGVGVFFVLSGFVITYQYYASATIERVWLKKYYVARFARIYPVFWAMSAVWILFDFNPFGFALRNGQWAAYLTLLHGLVGQNRYWGISQAWSLTVELCFYLLAPFVFVGIRRVGLMAILGIPFVGLLLVWSGLHSLESFVLFTFFGRFWEFGVGALIAWLYCYKKCFQDLVKGKLWSWVWSLASVALLVVVLVWLACIPSSAAFALACGFSYSDEGLLSWIGVGINNVILPLAVGIVVIVCLSGRSFIARLCGSRFLVWAGKISYAFYLCHGMVLLCLPHDLRFRWYLSLSVSVFISWVVYRWFEAPVNSWIRRLLS